MKRTVALTILGVAMANTVFGQGHVLVSNYNISPYNQVLLDGVGPLNDVSISLSFWVAPGAGQPEGSLVPSASPSFTVNPGITYAGGGYYDVQTMLTPGTGAFTFQIRATGPGVVEATSRSALFNTVSDPIANPAPADANSVGLTIFVPEPTTFALAGLGAAALLIFRRRD